MVPWMIRLRDVRFLRYFFASLGALAVDLSVFMGMMAAGILAAPASAAGYATGILAHWLMSSRAVFAEGVAQPGPGRTVQKALFVGSALLGLAMTTAIVGLGDSAGIDPRLAKLGAIGVSFLANWLMRSQFIFTPRCHALGR